MRTGDQDQAERRPMVASILRSPPQASILPRAVIRFMRRESGGTKANQFVRQRSDVPALPSLAEMPSVGVSSLDCAGLCLRARRLFREARHG